MRRAIIKVGYRCNQGCLFCHVGEDRGISSSRDAVNRKIARARALGHDMVVLSGGEPTIRTELLAWAVEVQRHGMDFGLITNGQMLAYGDRVAQLLRRRLRYVYLSLHGGSRSIHDALVRADAFDHTVEAIANLVKQPLELTVNCVVTQKNIAHLRDLVALLDRFGGLTVHFSMLEPKGLGLRHQRQLAVGAKDVAAAVEDAVAYGSALAGRLRFAHADIPLCLLPGREGLHADLRGHGFVSMSEATETDFFPVDRRNKTHLQPCEACSLRGACPGVFGGNGDTHLAQELRPVRGRRSNSFNYRPIRELRWPRGEPCPLLSDGVTPYDLARHLFVRKGERMVLCETRSNDFADAEIALTKRRHGQIYTDRRDGDAVSDFSRQLRKLTPLAACRRCPELERCAGCYVRQQKDPFAQDDAEVCERLGDLRGRVLDVGCGDGRYAATFGPLIGEGLVCYHGVDPDGERLSRLRQRLPGAQLSPLPIEELSLTAASFDHVLLLHSLNHLAEPRQSVARLVSALRIGGTLLVADDVAFGLLRSEAATARAEASAAVFEHHRNHSCEQASRLLEGLAVELLARRDVGPSTSSQWFLHYRRTDG